MLESALEANSTNAKSSLRSLILRLSFVMVGTIFFGLVIPAIAAAYSGVFFLENLKTKVGATYPDVVLSWQNFKEQQERLRNAVKKIEYDIELSEGPTSKIDELIKKKI